MLLSLNFCVLHNKVIIIMSLNLMKMKDSGFRNKI